MTARKTAPITDDYGVEFQKVEDTDTVDDPTPEVVTQCLAPMPCDCLACTPA